MLPAGFHHRPRQPADAPTRASAPTGLAKDEVDRALYALGVSLGRSLDGFALSAAELERVIAGLRAVNTDQVTAEGLEGSPHLRAFEFERREKRLALVQDYLFHHYAEPVSVPALASLVRLNPRYFGNWFSERTGMTVKEYVHRIRIRKATDLLATGGFNVAEAAYRSGFEDVFYFSKVFKRIAGHPPSDLIRSVPVRGGPIPD